MLQPVAPVREIPGDVVELRPGQPFTARIQEVLPENTYKALVAGQSMTLALPEGAKAGDTLELVVIDRTPRLIVAQLAANAGEAAAPAGHEAANLSRTALLIGALLTRDGAPPPPAALTRGQPLVAHPAPDGATLAAELAPRLAQAVSQSGLFYEAHQAQWVLGQRPLPDLKAEPQAAFSGSAGAASADGVPTPRSGEPASRGEAGSTMVLLRNFFGSAEGSAEPATPLREAPTPAQAVPEGLRPLVQQQLDAVATQRLAWHGEVWPDQTMQWQIEPDQRGVAADADDTERGWITSLHLVTPRLGEIDARLALGAKGVSISLRTPVGASAADLLDAAPALRDALAAAGVPLLGLQVKHDLPG